MKIERNTVIKEDIVRQEQKFQKLSRGHWRSFDSWHTHKIQQNHNSMVIEADIPMSYEWFAVNKPICKWFFMIYDNNGSDMVPSNIVLRLYDTYKH